MKTPGPSPIRCHPLPRSVPCERNNARHTEMGVTQGRSAPHAVTMSYRIIEVPEPTSATDTPSWQATAVAEVSEAIDIETWGNDDLAISAQQVVAGLAHQENAVKRRFVAVDAAVDDPTASDVLGIGDVWMPRHDHVATAGVDRGTRPDARGRGVGAALWAHAPDALAPPTGDGRVPASAPGTRFALARGCRLEQAERHSVLEVPVDPDLLDRLGDEAAERAGTDYELVAWSDRVPDEWVEEFCVLQTAMSTDAPTAGLTTAEEVWTPERVRSVESAIADNGMSTMTVAALHRPSGQLAGYTELSFVDHKPQACFQENTIVRSEHRGHRLGMLLKVANLRRLATERPQVRRVHTWNAEENDHMLSINVALGFRPAGGGAGWELRLED